MCEHPLMLPVKEVVRVPRWVAVLWLLLPLAGCETTTTSSLREADAWNEPEFVTFTPALGRQRVDVPDEDFRVFMRQMGMRVTVEGFKALMEELGVHLRTASAPQARRVVFVSWEPPAQGFRDYLGWCRPLERCIALPDDGRAFGPEARHAIAVDIALHSIWPGVVEAAGGMLDIRQLEVMVVTTLVVYLGLLVAPEPVTKVIAAKMTYILLSYLGVTTLWHLLDAWRQMASELEAAHTFSAVYAAGERFGNKIGAQVARVLVTLVTWALGGRLGGALPKVSIGGMPPGASNAAQMLATEARGIATVPPVEAVRSVVLGGERVTFAFSSGAVVATEQAVSQKEKEPAQKQIGPRQRPSGSVRVPVVMPSGQDEEDDDGPWHHIATNKNRDSDVNGGPWTPVFERIFDKAGMTLNDPANLVRVKGHKGPHPEEYHREVFDRLNAATATCRSVPECRNALTVELRELAREVSTPGTRLNLLITDRAAP